MCYTGTCIYEDFHGTCNGVPSHCCLNIMFGRGELKLKKTERDIISVRFIKDMSEVTNIDFDLDNIPF